MKEYKDYHYLTKAVTLPDGKRKYIRAKTRRELDKKVLEFQISLARNDIFISPDITVEQLATLWLEKVKKPSVKPQSYAIYSAHVTHHIVPAIGSMKISDVKMVHILEILNEHGFKSKDANRKLLTSVRAIFRFGVENDMLQKSPVPARMSVVGSAVRDDKPLTPNQTLMLLDYCQQNEKSDVYLFTYLALVTGMRRSELAALR